MKTIATLLTLPLVLAACGDDKISDLPDAAGSADAHPPAAPVAIVVSGDFTPGDPGIMASIDPVTQKVTKAIAPQGAVGDDPVLRHVGHELLIVNRNDGNNVTILDDQSFTLIAQLGTGTNTNPQDVAVSGQKLYVPTFSGKGVVVIDRVSMVKTEIDLGADDPDGQPNCESIALVGGKLFVACGLLDDTMMYKPPRGLGKIYEIDPATDQKVGSITLTTKNPVGFLEESPGSGGGLVVPTNDYATGEGCIEHIPTSGGTATACVVMNADMGSFFASSRVAFTGTGDAAIMYLVASAYPDGKVLGYDYATHGLFPAQLTATTQVAGDLAVCPGGQVLYSDQAAAASGIRERDTTKELTTAPLDVGLKPNSTHGIVCY